MRNLRTRRLRRKLSQLPSSEETKEMYAYYCILCEEILALSKRKINPRKITLLFDDKCPDCGFALPKVLNCEITRISKEIGQLMDPKISDPNTLSESNLHDELKICTANTFQTGLELNLTGIGQLDNAIKLQLGQFVALYEKAAEQLLSTICVRATLPKPRCLDSDIIFLDGGNTFNVYTISNYAIHYQLNPEKTLARIHLSRAFTYHQLSTLINEKLLHAINLFKAKLVTISDITALYCDPDVTKRNRQESLDIFRRDVKTLTTLVEKKQSVNNRNKSSTKNSRMDTTLLQTASVSAKLEDHTTFTQLTLVRHPFTPQLKTRIFLDKQTLESYI